MKAPSLNHLFKIAAATFLRFYLPILIAIFGSCLAIYMIDKESGQSATLIACLYTAIVGLPCAIAAAVLAEQYTGIAKRLIALAPLPFLVFYALFAAPRHFDQISRLVVFFVLCIIMHLWVAVAPYIGKGEHKGFWWYNQALYSRMIIGGIFSAALFAGLSIAILALDNLLKLPVGDKIYGQLFIVVAGVFNTWFFLAGVPGSYTSLDEQRQYPKGLGIFSQYILIPLATIYMAILYVYGGKILFLWSLPKGWVSMLILWYSVVGILAILLSYPLRNHTDKAWVKLFSRFFFIGLLPILVLLFVAVGTRVGEYGITEPRYYILLLGVWLLAIALYFIISKRKSIWLIPVTLIVAGLISIVGPLSATNVSLLSQKKRFHHLLVANKILVAGKLTGNPDINDTVGREIRSVVSFFVEREKEKMLEPVYKQDLTGVRTAISKQVKPRNYSWRYYEEKGLMEDTLMTMLHLSHDYSPYAYSNYQTYGNSDKSVQTTGYNFVIDYTRYEYSSNNRDTVVLAPSDTVYIVYVATPLPVLRIETKVGPVSTIQLNPLFDSLSGSGKGTFPATEMTVNGSGTRDARLLVKDIVFSKGKSYNMYSLEGYILIK